MIKKTFAILLLVFTVQTITSCITECGQKPGTFENKYNSVTITAYDNAGFYSKPIVDSVYKNAFGLTVSVNFESTQIALAMPKQNLSGFSTLMAIDCPGDTYTYPDPIKNVEIYATDIETGEKTNVSDLFGIAAYYDSELISLEQFFIEREEWHDGFQFEMVSWDSIPNSVIFTAEAHLVSGTVFIAETEQINFYKL